MENLENYILQKKELKQVQGGGKWIWDSSTEEWVWIDN